MSVFLGCFIETRNDSIISLAFIARSFRVTEENLIFETVQSGPYSSSECFLCSSRNSCLCFIRPGHQLHTANLRVEPTCMQHFKENISLHVWVRSPMPSLFPNAAFAGLKS